LFCLSPENGILIGSLCSAYEKWKAMDQLLEKGKQMQYECANEVKKLRAMLHSTEEQLRVHKKQTMSFATMVEKLRAMLHSTEEQLQVHKKQTMFLTHLTAKTLPKGLHCLPLRLTTEYYNLNSSEQQFPNQEILDNPLLHHIALFSDNVLAAAVVVNSTVTNSKVNKICHINMLILVAREMLESRRISN
jgi:alpha-1,4-galacturonosyltransferase